MLAFPLILQFSVDKKKLPKRVRGRSIFVRNTTKMEDNIGIGDVILRVTKTKWKGVTQRLRDSFFFTWRF